MLKTAERGWGRLQGSVSAFSTYKYSLFHLPSVFL